MGAIGLWRQGNTVSCKISYDGSERRAFLTPHRAGMCAGKTEDYNFTIMMVPLMDEKNCFVACDSETVLRGGCSCYNRITSAVSDGRDIHLLKLRGGKQRFILSRKDNSDK